MMNNFLPEGYEVPQKSADYMKLLDGENRFRICGTPILGWKWWKKEDGSEKPKPYRIPMDAEVPKSIKPDDVKHFWAVVVWNYKEERFQVLELTQKGIQEEIAQLAAEVDWGNPEDYDISIIKSGQKLDTKYLVHPKPKKPLDPGIKQLFKDMQIDLTALYRGSDPFHKNDESKKTGDAEDSE